MSLPFRPGGEGVDPIGLGRATVAIVAVCLVVLAGFGFSLGEIRDKITAQAEANFRLDARDEIDAVEAAMTAAASAAETAGRFAASANGVNPIGFSGFLGGITVQYPWIDAIEWAPKVTAMRRSSFVVGARPELPGYQILDPGPGGTLRPAALRPVYFPVTLVEPLSALSKVVGLDAAAVPGVAQVLDAAAASGSLQATGVIHGLREIPGGVGVILAWPVFNDVPAAGEDPTTWRRHNLRGFALAAVDIRRVIEQAADAASGGAVSIEPSAQPGPPAVAVDADNFAIGGQVALGGQVFWFVLRAPEDIYLPSPLVRWLALGALTFLFVMVLVAGVSVRSVVKRSLLIRRLNLEMAAAAKYTRDILETLREPVVIVDSAAAIVTVNRAWNDWRRNHHGPTVAEVPSGNYLDAFLSGDPTIAKAHETALRTAVAAVLAGVDEDRECDVRTLDLKEIEHWFTIRICAFSHGTQRHALIAHTDISRLKKAEQELRQLAITDGLTQIANRRHFDERIHEEIDRSQRYGRPLMLMLLDIDHFKKVNDTYGHPAGDAVLRMVADVCKRSTRTLDLIARFGGEEFAMLLPETDLPGALQLAERIREEVAALACVYEQDVIHVTVSIGLAALDAADATAERLTRDADESLYAAKQCGRNRVVCHPL